MSGFKFDIRIVLVVLFTAVAGLLVLLSSSQKPSKRGWQNAPNVNPMYFDKFVHLRARQESKRLTLYSNYCYAWYTSSGSSKDAVPWFTKTALFGDNNYTQYNSREIWRQGHARMVVFTANKATTITVREFKNIASGSSGFCGFLPHIVKQK